MILVILRIICIRNPLNVAVGECYTLFAFSLDVIFGRATCLNVFYVVSGCDFSNLSRDFSYCPVSRVVSLKYLVITLLNYLL